MFLEVETTTKTQQREKTATYASVLVTMVASLALAAGLLTSVAKLLIQEEPQPAPTIKTYEGATPAFSLYTQEGQQVPTSLIVKFGDISQSENTIQQATSAAIQTLYKKEVVAPEEISSDEIESEKELEALRVPEVKKLIPDRVSSQGTDPGIAAPGAPEGNGWGDTIRVLHFSDEVDVNQLIPFFAKQANVEYVEPNSYISIDQVDAKPNDPFYGSQGTWNQSYSDMWGLKQIGLTQKASGSSGWDVTTGSEDVVMAVIDTGIDYTHRDLADRMWINPGEDINQNGRVDGERWDDTGRDGLYSRQEPNWTPFDTPDPTGDNFDAAANPEGTEGNFRYDAGEPFEDCGLDGLCPGDPLYLAPDSDGTEGNGLFDAGDFDFIDSDNNGYVDDIRGWDFGGWGLYNYRDYLFDSRPATFDSDPMDSFGHGTHIAGTIGAATDNGVGISGINWNSKIMNVKALWDGAGSGPIENFVLAIKYAVDNGATVINASWGLQNHSELLHDAVQYAYNQGVVFVAAAGNDNQDVHFQEPASYPEVITVAASTPTKQRAYFSNYGVPIDVSAPGGGDSKTNASEKYNILSLSARNSVIAGNSGVPKYGPNNEYAGLAGTSMATPHVVGAVSLVQSAHPDWGIEEIRQALRSTAEDIESPGWDTKTGYGLMNARAALDAGKPLRTHMSSPTSGTIFNNENPNLNIKGSVSGQGFVSYTVAIGEGDMPDSWTELYTASTEVEFDSLMPAINMQTYTLGRYTVRIQASNSIGQTFEDRTLIIVGPSYQSGFPFYTNDPFISASPTVDDINEDGVQDIVFSGIGKFDQMQGTTYAVSGAGEYVEGWPSIFNSGTIGANTIADVTQNASGKEVAIYNNNRMNFAKADGGKLSSSLSPVHFLSSGRVPKIVDINFDGNPEIISHDVAGGATRILVTSNNGQLLWGNVVTGSSVETAVGNFDTTKELEIATTAGKVFNHDGTLKFDFNGEFEEGIFADLDGDGIDELIYTRYKPSLQIYVYRSDGKLKEGWPVEVQGIVFEGTRTIMPVVGDVTGDGKADIIVLHDKQLVAFDSSGALLSGWPVILPSAEARWSAVLGDIDTDPEQEIVFNTSAGEVFAYNGDGTIVPGWPIYTRAFLNNSPAIADLDGDGDTEVIVVGGQFDPRGGVYVFDTPGRSVEWPMFMQNPEHTGSIQAQKDFVSAELVGELSLETADPRLNNPVHIKATIGNLGQEAAVNFVVRMYQTPEDGIRRQVGSDITISSIEGGEVFTFNQNIEFNDISDVGEHLIEMELDVENDIVEAKENNTFSISFAVAYPNFVTEAYDPGCKTYGAYNDFNEDYIVVECLPTVDNGNRNQLKIIDRATREVSIMAESGVDGSEWPHEAEIDGAYILYKDITTYSDNSSTVRIVYANIQTGEKFEIPMPESMFNANVSVDNGNIVWAQYNANRVYGNKHLYLYDFNAKALRRLVADSASDNRNIPPQIIGNRITWMNSIGWNGSDVYDFHVYDLNTDTDRVLVNFKYANDYVFNGNEVYYNMQSGLELEGISIDGTQLTPIRHARYPDSEGDFLAYLDYSKMSLPVVVTHIPTARFLQLPIYPKNDQPVLHGNTVMYMAADNKIYLTQFSFYNHPPEIINVPDTYTLRDGEEVTFTVEAADQDADDVLLRAQKLPIGATFNEQTGVFAWSPDYDSEYINPPTAVFTATDPFGAFDSQEISFIFPSISTCFIGGTQILMADGSVKNIEDIVPGDSVKSYDESSGEFVTSIVAQTFAHETSEIISLNDLVLVTSEHPLYVNGAWKLARDIQIGDELLNENSNTVEVRTKAIRNIPRTMVYNLAVDVPHTFIANGIIVHNKAPLPEPQPVRDPIIIE